MLDPAAQIAARTTLQIGADEDFLPDPAPQSLVDDIAGQGLNVPDYLEPDAASPSGFVLRNPVYVNFPGGYNPDFGADITDLAFVAGARAGQHIEDRLALLNNTITDAEVAPLQAAGILNAGLLLGSSANFFVNGFDSEISGIDLAITTTFDEVLGGALTVDLRHNWNEPKVSNVSPGDASDRYSYDAGVLVDMEVGVNFLEHYRVTLGGENVFDEVPDDEKEPVSRFLGVDGRPVQGRRPPLTAA